MIDMNVSEYTYNLLGCISVFYRISPQIIEEEQARKLQDAQAERLTSWEAHKLANWQADKSTTDKLTSWKIDKLPD